MKKAHSCTRSAQDVESKIERGPISHIYLAIGVVNFSSVGCFRDKTMCSHTEDSVKVLQWYHSSHRATSTIQDDGWV